MTRARRPGAPRLPDPPPMRTNDQIVALGGTAAWAVALVVLLLVGLPERDRWWIWTCAAGIGIGIFASFYLRRLHRRHREPDA